jgi:glycosyltransferase involved in cell wall biosynthesis
MVSVIIPVNNAAPFITEAVHSACIQSEVSEVLLIEDGSTDDSLEICRNLVNKYPKVFLYQHPGGINKGVGASRNLGFMQAKYEWIAFLDADDYFVENRFKSTFEYIQTHPEIDAIGEPIGAVFQDEKGKQQFLKHLKLSADIKQEEIVTKLNIDVSANKTFETLFLGKHGHQSIIGMMVHRRSFEKTGLINENWSIAEDSNFLLRLAYSCSFKCFSNSSIVAIRRIHSGNRWNASLKKRLYYYSLHIKDLYNFIDLKTLSKKAAKKMVWAYVRSHKIGYFQTDNKILKIYYAVHGYIFLLRYNPGLLRKAYF